MTRTHGDAKDHRPDLQHAVLELMVSHDGGMPFVRHSWDGHAAATEIVQARAAARIATLQRSPTPRYVVADAPLYNEAKAANRRALGLITRIPHTRTRVSQVSTPARRWDTWQQLDATTRDPRVEWRHDGLSPRWLVVSSEAAWQRTEATISHARPREAEVIDTPLLHWQATRVETPKAAQAALETLAPAWHYHQVATSSLIDHKRDACTGRPTPTTPLKAIAWQIHARVRPDDAQLGHQKPLNAGFVVGTTRDTSPLSDAAVIRAYTGQAQAEAGCRLLNDPRCFVSSLLVQKPWRMQGLLLVMTWALLVYAVTPRRLRHQWARQGETVPNQINQPTARPTVRWVFQRLEGIHRVRVTVPGKVHDLIEGLNHGHIKILRFFGEEVCRLYQISPG